MTKTDRDKIYYLIEDSPANTWFPNNAEKLRLANHLVAAGVTVRRWIPVTEQWYPGPGRVLATDGKQVYLTNGEWFYRSPEGKIRIPANYGNGADVTHWMPLPELPKEG